MRGADLLARLLRPIEDLLHRLGLSAGSHMGHPPGFSWSAVGGVVHLAGWMALALLVAGAALAAIRLETRRRRGRELATVEVRLSRDDRAGTVEVEAFLAGIHGLLQPHSAARMLTGAPHLARTLVRDADGGLRILLTLPTPLVSSLEALVQTAYPNAVLVRTQLPPVPAGPLYRLVQEQTSEAATASQRTYDHNTIEAVLAVLGRAGGPAVVQETLVPAAGRWRPRLARRHEARERAQAYETMTTKARAAQKGGLDVAGRELFHLGIKAVGAEAADARLALAPYTALAAENRLCRRRVVLGARLARRQVARGLSPLRHPRLRNLYSPKVLAPTWALPTGRLRLGGLERVATRRAPVPAAARTTGEGLVDLEDGTRVGIADGDRFAGALVLGVQGMGKSETLRRVFRADGKAAKARVLLDGKGDLAAEEASRLRGASGVWYLDLAEPAFGLDLLGAAASPSVLADDLIAALGQGLGPEAIGPRSESLLRAVILGVLATELRAGGLWEVRRQLASDEDRQHLAQLLELSGADPYLRHYYAELVEGTRRHPRFWEEALAAPRNKLDRLLAAPELRAVVSPGAVDASLPMVDLAEVVGSGGTLIVNAAKAAVGEANAATLANFLLAALWQGLLRVGHDLNPGGRPRTGLVVDEAHNFSARVVARMLAEGRAFGLEPVVGLQYLGQLPDDLRAAYTGLLGHRILFRTQDVADARLLAAWLQRVYADRISADEEAQDLLHFGPDDLMTLPRHRAICQWLAAGEPLPPFLASTIPPDEEVAA